ncbi:MAG: hypothetical protein E6R04_11945 [Spirochaetes bacterium]|nr:MAG: hypothetical protein E6R04_11945 [Spirochaetota bacterium]
MTKKHAKYNWEALKAEFFLSDFLEVKGFFQSRFGVYTSTINNRTTGWTVEKKAFTKSIAERAIKEGGEKRKEELKEALENIQDWFKNKAKQTKGLNPKGAAIVWKVLRVENELPTNINKTENTNIELQQLQKAREDLDKNIDDL